MNAEERMTKGQLEEEILTFSEGFFRRFVFSQLEIYPISMKNGEKSTRGRAAIIIENGKHPVITV